MGPGDLNKAIINSSKAHLIVLVPNVPVTDTYIKQMELNKEFEADKETHWFENPLAVIGMRNKFRSFAEFAAISKPEEVKCIVAHCKEYSSDDKCNIKTSAKENSKLVTVELYADGEVEPEKDYFIPSKPRGFEVTEVAGNSITFKWKQPLVGEKSIKSYVVSYRKINETTVSSVVTASSPVVSSVVTALSPAVSGDDKADKHPPVMTKETEDTTITINRLKQGVKHRFVVQAKCKVGLCEKSEEKEA